MIKDCNNNITYSLDLSFIICLSLYTVLPLGAPVVVGATGGVVPSTV